MLPQEWSALDVSYLAMGKHKEPFVADWFLLAWDPQQKVTIWSQGVESRTTVLCSWLDVKFCLRRMQKAWPFKDGGNFEIFTSEN